MIYLIGSLKNPEIPKIAQKLREATNQEVFDSWYSPGPEADDFLRDHIRFRGLSYPEAMNEYAVKHIFQFDKTHIDRAETVVMIMPAGKSGHLELGYAIGSGKRGYILFDKEPERFDVMHRFANEVFLDINKLIERLNEKREVGPILLGDGTVCVFCFQGPVNKDGRCYSCGKQFSNEPRI